jgi:hypothetical protein
LDDLTPELIEKLQRFGMKFAREHEIIPKNPYLYDHTRATFAIGNSKFGHEQKAPNLPPDPEEVVELRAREPLHLWVHSIQHEIGHAAYIAQLLPKRIAFLWQDDIRRAVGYSVPLYYTSHFTLEYMELVYINAAKVGWRRPDEEEHEIVAEELANRNVFIDAAELMVSRFQHKLNERLPITKEDVLWCYRQFMHVARPTSTVVTHEARRRCQQFAKEQKDQQLITDQLNTLLRFGHHMQQQQPTYKTYKLGLETYRDCIEMGKRTLANMAVYQAQTISTFLNVLLDNMSLHNESFDLAIRRTTKAFEGHLDELDPRDQYSGEHLQEIVFNGLQWILTCAWRRKK